jgi:hypothetical protein
VVHRSTGFLRCLLSVALGAAGLVGSWLMIAHPVERGARVELAAATSIPATGGPIGRPLIANPGRSTPRPALFFGYVEFDQDADAPGGVPGFGPWTSARVAIAGPSD